MPAALNTEIILEFCFAHTNGRTSQPARDCCRFARNTFSMTIPCLREFSVLSVLPSADRTPSAELRICATCYFCVKVIFGHVLGDLEFFMISSKTPCLLISQQRKQFPRSVETGYWSTYFLSSSDQLQYHADYPTSHGFAILSVMDFRPQIIVVGGGHAGAEAALVSARMGVKTLLVTGLEDTIARMPCNPSIGGLAKSHLVFELDSLGGEMGFNADLTSLQEKTLNLSRGPAVRATRAQCDKQEYTKRMQRVVRSQPNLELLQDLVTSVETDELCSRIIGVSTLSHGFIPSHSSHSWNFIAWTYFYRERMQRFRRRWSTSRQCP